MEFYEVLSSLRRERGVSQKQAAVDLNVSQALLSHYENGVREPRLEFVVRACDYYGVSADVMLGREYPALFQDNRLYRENIHRLLDKISVQKETGLQTLIENSCEQALERVLYLLEHPGSVLPPELYIRELETDSHLIAYLQKDLDGENTEG